MENSFDDYNKTFSMNEHRPDFFYVRVICILIHERVKTT